MKPGTLVIAQIDSGSVAEVTAELVTAALELGDPVTLGIVAVDPGSIENLSISGVDRVFGIRLPVDQAGHEAQQKAVEALIDFCGPRMVLMPFSWETAAFAAGLAENRDYCFASDVIGLSHEADGELVAIRPVYGGKVCARLGLPAGIPAILLLRPGHWAAAEVSSCELAMEMVDANFPDTSRVRLVKVIDPLTDDTDLAQADIIFAVGRGVGTSENIAVFEEIVQKLGVSLGASRPLVDVGLIPRALQIGQSGVTVAPKLYVAFGISGSLQHMAGVSGCTTIVAINTDGEAPIFDSAQFGAQVDAMEVARELLAEG